MAPLASLKVRFLRKMFVTTMSGACNLFSTFIRDERGQNRRAFPLLEDEERLFGATLVRYHEWVLED